MSLIMVRDCEIRGCRALKSRSDHELMAMLARGSRSALAALVERHQQRVLELAYRTLGSWEWAEDIGQETFLRVWRSADQYQPQARLTTWLYRIVVNLCLDARNKRRPVAVDPPDAPDPAAVGPSVALETAERTAAIQAAVTQLPDRQRVALILHRFSDLTIRDVAEATGWTESAVESLLVRAYANLRRKLEKVAES
jgi:RNA polymerase sigma-70 factor (ECF subfamily)